MSSTENTVVNTAAATAVEAPASHTDIIKQAIDLIDTSARFLSIEDAENVMESLEDLQSSISDMVMSRIPADRLSMVEGKWYIAVITESNDPADALAKYKAVLAASPLNALEGYAAQMLAETRREEGRFLALVAEPFDKDFAEYYAQELGPVTARQESLDTALEEIRCVMSNHYGEAIASTVGLDPAIIESLVAFLASPNSCGSAADQGE